MEFKPKQLTEKFTFRYLDEVLKEEEEKAKKAMEELQNELDEKGAVITFPDGSQYRVEAGKIRVSVDDNPYRGPEIVFDTPKEFEKETKPSLD